MTSRISSTVSKVRQALKNDRKLARSIAHKLLDCPRTADVGALCSGIVAKAEGFDTLAYQLFNTEPDLALLYAPVEWITASLLCRPDAQEAQILCTKLLMRRCAQPDLYLALALEMLRFGRLDTARSLFAAAEERAGASQEAIAKVRRHLEIASSERERIEANAPSRAIHVSIGCGPVEVTKGLRYDLSPLLLLKCIRDNCVVPAETINALCGTTTSGETLAHVLLTGDAFDLFASGWRTSSQRYCLIAHNVCIDRRFAEVAANLHRYSCSIILSLCSIDPDCLNASLLSWLRRNQPVACARETEALLLRQLGIDTFVVGRISTLSADERKELAAWLASELPHLARSAPVSIAWGNALRHVLQRLALADSEGSDVAPKTPCNHVAYRHEADPITVSDDFSGNLLECFSAVLPLAARGASPDDIHRHWRRWSARYVALFEQQILAAVPELQGSVETLLSTIDYRAQTRSEESALQIASAVDNSQWPYLLVMLESLLENSSLPVALHLLLRGIDPARCEELERIFGDSLQVSFYLCDEVFYGPGTRTLSHTSVSTLDRLLLPELLSELDKVIYLDVDLIVLGDLAELWKLDIGSARLAAKSTSSPRAAYVFQMVESALRRLPAPDAARARRRLYRDQSIWHRSFNAGVLILNLARMRRDSFIRRYVPLISAYGFNDQDVLNVYGASERVELSAEWNAIPRQDVTTDAKLVHFAGPVKPWGDLYIHRTKDFKRYEASLRARQSHRG